MKIDAESRLKKANYAEEDQLRMRGVRAKLRWRRPVVRKIMLAHNRVILVDR